MSEISIIKIDTDTISVWRNGRLIDTSPQVAVLTVDGGFISHEVSAKTMAGPKAIISTSIAAKPIGPPAQRRAAKTG